MLAALLFSSVTAGAAASRIDDPTSFVTEVYRHLVATQSTDNPYTPPDDIYTARLGKLLSDDKKRANGEVGCLDFDFWVNAQDWKITKLAISGVAVGKDRKTVIAKFLNIGKPQEIHFDFLRSGDRWLLDDVHSATAPRWTLSKILKCTP